MDNVEIEGSVGTLGILRTTNKSQYGHWRKGGKCGNPSNTPNKRPPSLSPCAEGCLR